jgi:hypothetical protein
VKATNIGKNNFQIIMNHSIKSEYPFCVWGSTVFFIPFLLTIITYTPFLLNGTDEFNARFIEGCIEFLFFTILFGIFLSIPTLGIFYAAFKKLISIKISPVLIKLILLAIAIISLLTTFYLIGTIKGPFPISYSFGILLFGLIYKLKSQPISKTE